MVEFELCVTQAHDPFSGHQILYRKCSAKMGQPKRALKTLKIIKRFDLCNQAY